MIKRATDIKASIRNSSLFGALTPVVRARLAKCVKPLAPRRGTRIYGVGEHCAGIYLVTDGCIMLSVGATRDASKVIDLKCNGEHFGLAGAMQATPQPVAAEALVDSVLLMLPRTMLIKQMVAIPQISLHVAAALGREICELIDEIEGYSLHSGRKRLVNYLKKIATAGSVTGGPFSLPAPKSIIASRLGLTPEYFSRILHELGAAGAIAVAGRHITILDNTRLADFGNPEADQVPAQVAHAGRSVPGRGR